MRNEPSNTDARSLLEQEFTRRLQRNPRYSLRAFAQTLGISHSLLSLILSGKRPISLKTLRRAAQVLDLSGEDRARLQYALGTSFTGEVVPDEYQQLSLDQFALVSDWYHFAILSLLDLPGFKLEPRWIARKLAISQLQARLAISRLKRLGILAEVDGQWRQVTPPLRVDNKVPHEASRQHQRQMIRKAEESMERDRFEVRDMSSTTLAMDPADLPYARKRIQQFRRQLAAELESRKRKAVYHLAVQLYPVTRPERSL